MYDMFYSSKNKKKKKKKEENKRRSKSPDAQESAAKATHSITISITVKNAHTARDPLYNVGTAT